jgi:hypothetical protein
MPQYPAFDPENGYVYVPNELEGVVTVVNATGMVAIVPVPNSVMAAAFDPANGYVYVTGFGDPGVVNVINGTTLLANISLGAYHPYDSDGIAYDPVNGYVYIASDTDSGIPGVSIINGTSVVATVRLGPQTDFARSVICDGRTGIIYVTMGGKLVLIQGSSIVGNITIRAADDGTYDPENGYVYVGGPTSDNVTLVSGTRVVGEIDIGGMTGPAAYDAGNGYVYANAGAVHGLAVLNGTGVVGTVVVADWAVGMTYDSRNGCFFVTTLAGGYYAAGIISTLLAETPSQMEPTGNPYESMDVGQTVIFNSTLWGVGTMNDTTQVAVSPSVGLGCAASPSFVLRPGMGRIHLACSPLVSGNYTVWLNVTDSLNHTVWSRIPIQVFPALVATPPVVTTLQREVISSADEAEWVNLSEAPQGGTGNYSSVVWAGLPPGACNRNTSLDLGCIFSFPEALVVNVSLSDSNGENATSALWSLTIATDPAVGRPTASRPTTDVGQPVGFSERASGGPGVFSGYSWDGLPAGGCTNLTTAAPTCVFSQPGVFSVSVAAIDVDGVTTTESPALAIRVYSLPLLGPTQADRRTMDVNQTVNFSASVFGGTGPYEYSWIGLPTGCSQVSTSMPVCTPSSSGLLTVRSAVTDGDGARVNSTSSTTVKVVPDPVVEAPVLSMDTVAPGQPVTIHAVVTGGAGNYTFAWFGLPPGCLLAGGSGTCTTTQPGSYYVSVRVVDGDGYAVESSTSTLVVTGGPPTVLGLPPAWFAIIMGAVGSAVVAAVAAYSRRATRSGACRSVFGAAGSAVEAWSGERADRTAGKEPMAVLHGPTRRHIQSAIRLPQTWHRLSCPSSHGMEAWGSSGTSVYDIPRMLGA